MSLPVEKVVNLSPGDLVVKWDEETAILYIMPGPETLGRGHAVILRPGEAEILSALGGKE